MAEPQKTPTIVPVILSGGAGTRLWPLSRTMYPKQFIEGLAGAGTSLFGRTLQRLPASAGFASPFIVSGNDYRFLVDAELERLAIAGASVVLEPVARNTAPAIAAAAVLAARRHRDSVMVVMPSDHAIGDDAAFARAVVAAAEAAVAGGRHVLFGIPPTTPHTGYGYIRQGEIISKSPPVHAVEAFTEKPSAKVAKTYLDSGKYFWNSGIFVLHVASLLADLRDLAPDILTAAEAACEQSTQDMGFTRLDQQAFARAPAISIDYALMEKTRRAAVMPLTSTWSDVGSWSSLWEIGERDATGNTTIGDVVLEDTENSYVRAERHLVATLGVKDLVIVDTPDALLVADKSRAEDVSKLVKSLKTRRRPEAEQHVRSFRPWGHFETLSIGQRFQVKKLHVKPGAKLSMQMHHHRSEHWIVVQGTAKVTIGDIDRLVRENESVYIFATQWHRLENPGKVPLELIEVQIGTYLGEDDIIRSDDIYRRAPDETR